MTMPEKATVVGAGRCRNEDRSEDAPCKTCAKRYQEKILSNRSTELAEKRLSEARFLLEDVTKKRQREKARFEEKVAQFLEHQHQMKAAFAKKELEFRVVIQQKEKEKQLAIEQKEKAIRDEMTENMTKMRQNTNREREILGIQHGNLVAQRDKQLKEAYDIIASLRHELKTSRGPEKNSRGSTTPHAQDDNPAKKRKLNEGSASRVHHPPPPPQNQATAAPMPANSLPISVAHPPAPANRPAAPTLPPGGYFQGSRPSPYLQTPPSDFYKPQYPPPQYPLRQGPSQQGPVPAMPPPGPRPPRQAPQHTPQQNLIWQRIPGRNIPCVTCWRNWWPCDGGQVCGNCIALGKLECPRSKCKQFELEPCKRNCHGVHQGESHLYGGLMEVEMVGRRQAQGKAPIPPVVGRAGVLGGK
ncbi:hypothetical protein P154DRAFT_575611 [Amniculicola lignicola CBS 123094]|uniref:Uncharacterized protein n=1 Tax=Amniculicola lignicola CBS 123094 TaxID=1392246 RepID=A0A6A5WG80_9PLEO|nr:hypothetical protein P154DRAFT_575611 [Amniculicola lignicola CBS 123094]